MKLDTSEISWQVVLEEAKILKRHKRKYFSPKDHKPYVIKSTTKNVITIKRHEGNDEYLRKGTLLSFIDKINKAGSLHRNECSNLRVATLATIVQLHPFLKWDDNNDIIIIIPNKGQDKIQYRDFGEPPNDNVNELQIFARKVRAGQSKFRKALLNNYRNKCCVTECTVLEVLDACHIEPHSKGGINQVDNGLLLRTDIHSLLDSDLLFVSPDDYRVHIHPSLSTSEYFDYNEIIISAKRLPNREYLKARWNQKKW